MARETGTLGARIREIRGRLELTQQELANTLGVDVIQISRWERGETTPRLGRLSHIAALADLTLAELFEGLEATR